MARAHGLDADADALVARLQDELFVLGSALADPSPEGPFHRAITAEHVEGLESAIDRLEEELAAARPLHPARRIAGRRADPPGAGGLPPRRAAGRDARPRPAQDVPAVIVIYLNRLSDLLFVLARAVNRRAGVADILWKGL